MSLTIMLRRADLLVWPAVLLTMFSISFAVAEVPPQRAQDVTTGTTAPESPPQFSYQLENRPDPFVPFITEKAASAKVDLNEIVESNEPLTGMQLFEPGQLTVVAILKKGVEDIAMVQDFTGKGYILKEGMKLGRRGVVKDIATNVVLIEQTAITRGKKKIVTEVPMLLKKEGDE